MFALHLHWDGRPTQSKERCQNSLPNIGELVLKCMQQVTKTYVDKFAPAVGDIGQGRIQGGGGPEPQDSPTPFGGPLNFMLKREKTLCACTRKHRISVLNSYPDTPPPFPKSCIRPCWITMVCIDPGFSHFSEISANITITVIVLNGSVTLCEKLVTTENEF